MSKPLKIVLIYLALLIPILLILFFTSEQLLNYLFAELSNVMTWLYFLTFEVVLILSLGIITNLKLYFKFKKKHILNKSKGYLVNTYITFFLLILPVFLLFLILKNS